MNWHTNQTGDTVCLFCYEEEPDVIVISSEEEESVSRKRKSKRKRSSSRHGNTTSMTTRSRCSFDNDDVEEAAHLLYHLILTVNKA
jgi:hypothetical protein